MDVQKRASTTFRKSYTETRSQEEDYMNKISLYYGIKKVRRNNPIYIHTADDYNNVTVKDVICYITIRGDVVTWLDSHTDIKKEI